MTAAVPISLREEGNTTSDNQVFGMVCSIASDIANPKERLLTIIGQSTKSKEMSHPLRALMPQMSQRLNARRADHGAGAGAALQPLEPV